ncbi:MAG: BamA/TamA family outer membrane protein [Alphaproteobacteria bacterium]|nr:BamA/TamA family outer membrane protein [Alphaproteobacteria bacterium]
MLGVLAAFATEVWQEEGIGGAALPALSYTTDEGLGMGLVGTLYTYDGETAPYRASVYALVYVTTRGVHAHAIELDWLNVAQLPLRVTARAELNVTRSATYCGVGPDVTCDPVVAAASVAAAGLEGEEATEAERTFYLLRRVQPVLRLDGRWKLGSGWSLLAGYRLQGSRPGDLKARTPFAHSLYARHFPEGERSMASVLQLGVMFDTRDEEPAPSRGVWAEATVRGASRLWGSTMGYVGANVTVRGYVPLVGDRLVLADRVVLDGLVGDAPTSELTIPGGTQTLLFYGDMTTGRGVRIGRYLGRTKVLQQLELRGSVWRPSLAGIELDLGGLAFIDLGFVGVDASDTRTLFTRPLPTVGGGLRIGVDHTFIIRADVGVSAMEGWSPYVYLDLDNLF